MDGQNFSVIQETGVAEFISGDKFATKV